MRHFTRIRRPFHVRLACVRHAASVQSEPESNSPVEKYLIQRTYCSQIELKALFPNSLFTCQRTAPLTRGGVVLCNFSFHLSTTFFKFFFRRRFRRALVRAAVPQRVFELCPHRPALSNTFLQFFHSFFIFICNILIKHNKKTNSDAVSSAPSRSKVTIRPKSALSASF